MLICWVQHLYKYQGCHILEKFLKVLDFSCCPGKSLNFVCKSWKMFIKFSRDLPGQNVKLFLFYDNWFLVTEQSHC